jgi:hypothetical protein
VSAVNDRLDAHGGRHSCFIWGHQFFHLEFLTCGIYLDRLLQDFPIGALTSSIDYHFARKLFFYNSCLHFSFFSHLLPFPLLHFSFFHLLPFPCCFDACMMIGGVYKEAVSKAKSSIGLILEECQWQIHTSSIPIRHLQTLGSTSL